MSRAIHDRARPALAASNRGYTMLELMVVATMVLAAVSTALPGLLRMRSNFSLQSNLRLVQVMIQTARYDALTQGVQFQIVFQATATPQLQLQRNTGTPLTPNFVNAGTPITLPGGSQMAKGGTLLFDPSGVVTWTGFDATADGNEGFLVLSHDVRSFQVYVTRLGRVRILKAS